ncbi:MAG TPA: DNA translocase FtsK 4TM domain-containing protein [Bacteroidia bacterium]|nr:DNA translocase FtsK 4TM domain-containing protein [Bacteroidia bacterium]
MAERKSNTLKKAKKGESIVEEKRVDKKNFLTNIFKSDKNPFADSRFRKICGLLFLLFSVYLFIALVSYLFTWQIDQDKVLGPWSAMKVSNWLGKIGAVISFQFVHQWFGIAAFIFVFLFFIIGIKILFNITLLPLARSLKISFFLLIWISATLGLVFQNNFSPGGGMGYNINLWLNQTIGKAGNVFLILFSFLGFLVMAFNISFDWFKSNKKETDEKEIIPEPANEQETEEVVNVVREDKIVSFDLTEETSSDNDIEDETETEEKKNEQIIDDNSVQFSIEETPAEKISAEDEKSENDLPFGEYDPTLELSSYQPPPIDLLENYGNKEINVNTEELTANKNKIVETLRNYSIEIEKIKATIGPTVTLYEIIPAAGVRISKIKNLEDDIALSLSALGIRIIAPIPGRGTIGIEVPNQNPETVAMRSMIASEKFQNTTMDLPIALGKTISNETFITDLAKMPHLLMAGATGQGKSVGLNAILVSLLYKKHPSQIKFVLVDPKKVELTLFNKIERHFLAKLPNSEEAIITDTKKVIHTLNSLCIEMDNRYDLLKNAQVRNIKEYNTKFIARKLNPNNGHKFLPYIILVVDEFADLIMTAGKEVEMPIARLAQLARAIGIHLIIATQRPSVNIITGTIKANFPARIAFRVTSKIDSRTILDSGGADQLIGRGDMLLSTGNDLIRLQCAFVDTPEVEKICDFIGSQRSYPEAFLLPEYVDENESGSSSNFSADDTDVLFEEAARIIVQHQQGSASLLQRRLKLGYNRAGRIIDQLETAKIIGPFEGSKAREVLIKDSMSLEQLLTNLKNGNSN